ncbi:MAG: type IV pilus modification PilV family protein [Planctomycetota bacterium]|jgi:prepilin-type N-terminal cleavage/methylation domain-containing protein
MSPSRRSLAPGTRYRAPDTRGFTLVEVLIALGIFLGAMMAILGIYFQNLRLARMAREEIIVSMIQRDIMARNQVVAVARAGHERSWRRGVWPTKPPFFHQFGSPRDGTEFGTAGSIGETTDPASALGAGWGVRNICTWERTSGLHWGRSNPVAETDVPLYENFYFTVHPVWRYANNTDANGDGFPDYPWVQRQYDPNTADEWKPATTSGMPGLAYEDSQFTDWDGYGWVDMDNDGDPETDRGVPYPSPGPIHSVVPAGFPGGSNTYDGNPYRIFYLSDKLGHYILRLRVRIMWQVKLEEDIYNQTDAMVLDRENKGERVFNHTEYFFSVFNPDIVKRWTP